MFDHILSSLKASHLLRTVRCVTSGQDAWLTIDGHSHGNFGSNNYLGFANDPALVEAATRAISSYGVGAGASRLITGTMTLHEACESALAKFKQTEAALLLNSGYTANLGLIPALVGPGDAILADRNNHASLVDGCRLSRASFKVYRHRDTEQLERLLARLPGQRKKLIVTDGVFSMEGDIAPLPRLLELAQQYDALLLVDDAHATGVLGAQGRGTCDHFQLADNRIIQMGTMSKALGGFGAYIAGTRSLIAFLQNRCRTFLYTTALPPALAAAAMTALQMIDTLPERRDTLWRHRHHCVVKLQTMGFDLMGSETPILPIRIGEPATALAMSEELLRFHCFVPAIRPPTVPRGTARLRISLMATHTMKAIDLLLDALRTVGTRHGVIH